MGEIYLRSSRNLNCLDVPYRVCKGRMNLQICLENEMPACVSDVSFVKKKKIHLHALITFHLDLSFLFSLCLEAFLLVCNHTSQFKTRCLLSSP